MKRVFEYIAIAVLWLLTLPLRVGMQIELLFWRIRYGK